MRFVKAFCIFFPLFLLIIKSEELLVTIDISSNTKKSSLTFAIRRPLSSSIISVYIVTEHTQIRILLTEFFTTYILPQAFTYKCLATIMIFVICTFIFCCSVDKVRIWVFKYIERLMPIFRKRI